MQRSISLLRQMEFAPDSSFEDSLNRNFALEITDACTSAMHKFACIGGVFIQVL